MIRGALGGLGATVAMSAVMLVRQRVAGVGTQEPKVITASGLAAVGADSSEGTLNALSVVAHLGYGSSMGALYGLAAPAAPLRPVASGPLYGLLVALASYEGWLPAMGILPPLRRLHPPRRWGLLAAHLVYGAVLGLLVGAGRGCERHG